MNIQHDPARRIRRIRRWLSKAVCVGAYSSLCHPFRRGDYEIWCDRVNFADSLFVRELAWLCGYAEEQAKMAEQYRADSMRNNETIRLYRERFAPRSILDVYDGNGD